MTLVYIGLGSNLGDREGHINRALSLLKVEGFLLKRVSPLNETEAVCRPGESMPSFLNGVAELETTLEPQGLLERLEGIERQMGRKEKGSWEPRSIDLDILFYGDRVVKSPRLRIPHPEIANRWFVLKPLSDLAPDFVHPVLRRIVRELLFDVSGSSSIRLQL